MTIQTQTKTASVVPQMARTTTLSISIVVPVYAGEGYLTDLAAEIEKTRQSMRDNNSPVAIAELIFVEDGAKDQSASIIDALANDHDWITALHLSRNYGQHPATIAGILHTAGDWVVTMDEDLQHKPSEIQELLGVVARDSADIVYGVSSDPVHQSMMRDLSSKNYKLFIEKLTGNAHIRKVSSFRLIRGTIARAASSVCGHDTYFDVALGWFTQRIKTCNVDMKDTRYIETGKSGYNFRALIAHARRLTFSSHIKLLRLGAVFGMFMLGLSVLAAIAVFGMHFLFPGVIEERGWASLMISIYALSGAILFLLGIVLEYVTILVMRAHGKPLYFIIDRSRDSELRA